MKKTLLLLVLLLPSFLGCGGCGYYKKYIKLKERVEELERELQEAQAEAEDAKKQLDDERKAMERIYTED